MEGFLPCSDEGDDPWRCRKHPSAQPRTGGVCPLCLRARLLRLCPECARERPRCCVCPSTSSSLRAPGSAAVGRVSHLVGRDPALVRSRSVATRPSRVRSDGGDGRAWLWPFGKAKKADRVEAKNPAAAPAPVQAPAPLAGLPRSRSVGMSRGVYGSDQGAAVQGGGGGKGWSRYFPIPSRSFRRTSKVIQARSPSAPTEEIPHLHT